MRKEFNQTLAKDHDLPIALYEDPYWDHFAQLYAPYWPIAELTKLLEQEVAQYGPDAFGRIFKVADLLIKQVQSTPAYLRLQSAKMDAYALSTKGSGRVNLYNREHQGQYLSIDIAQANFNVLRLHDPELFAGASTYEEWFRTVDTSEYLLRSKRLRQIIFGHLLPNRQQTMQKFYMTQVFNHLMKSLTKEQVHAASPDELVIALGSEAGAILVEKLRTSLAQDPTTASIAPYLRYDLFILKSLDSEKSWFVKEYSQPQGKVEFKNIPGHCLAEIVRRYRGQSPQADDRLFRYEGRLVRFEKSLFKDEE